MDKELVEFLEQRFEKSERRMEELIQEVRVEIQEARAESKDDNRQTRILVEDLRGQIQLVAEGVVNQGERLDRFREEAAEDSREMKALIRLSFAELEHRMKGLESRVDALDGRLTALENAA